MDPTARINKQRIHWINKAHRQLDEVLMASLDQDNEKHLEYREDLATSILIAWRFDKRLFDLKDMDVIDREVRNEE